MSSFTLMCTIIAPVSLLGALVQTEDVLPLLLFRNRQPSLHEAQLLSVIGNELGQHYMRSSRSSKRGRELFGKRSVGSSVDKVESLEAMRTDEDSAGLISNPSKMDSLEHERMSVEFSPKDVDAVHSVNMESEGLPTVRMWRMPEDGQQRQAEAFLRQARGRGHELFGR